MSPSESHESKPNSSASASGQSVPEHSGSNGVPVESVDGVDAQAMERLAEDSADFVEQLIDISTADPQITPVVEILPPEAASLDPDRLANMAVNRTQISLGLTGISFNRTRLSGASGQPTEGQTGSNSDPAAATSMRAAAPATAAGTAKSRSTAAPTTAGTVQADSPGSSTAPVGSVPVSSDPASGEEPDFENVQLFSQFVVGMASFGISELMERIHYFDEKITQDPDQYDLDKQIDQVEESIETIFRYWLIGTLMWGERTALSLSYRTFQRSIGLGSLIWRSADRTTDNFLLRPIRRRLERLSGALREDSQARIAEGQTVEQRGRVLAEETVNDIIGDFIDYLSDNPELIDLISDSGMGLAGNVMDSGRQIGAVTDTTVENVIRRIFRRPSRQELSPSPFDGKPQTMYDPTKQIQAHDEKAKR